MNREPRPEDEIVEQDEVVNPEDRDNGGVSVFGPGDFEMPNLEDIYNSDDEKGKDGKVEGYGKKKAVKEDNDPDETGPTPTPENEEEALVPVVQEDSDKRAGDPCWKGYKQVGMKKKDGKEVPNCVPMNEEELKEAGIDKSDVDYSHLEEEE